MKHQELIKGYVYTDILDVNIPLMFTGKKETRVQFGCESIIAYFKPVRTEKNKHWYNLVNTITKSFDDDYGNSLITI